MFSYRKQISSVGLATIDIFMFPKRSLKSARKPVHKGVFTFVITCFLLVATNMNCVFAQTPVPSFTVAGSVAGCAPFNVQFVNNSTNANSFLWDFGNGNTSTLANPTIVYLNAGVYSVKLIAFNANGNKDSLILSGFINVLQKPLTSFTVASAMTCENVPISFINNSQNADSSVWDFGDGTTSNQTNPSHSYANAGTYSVTLISFNSLYGCSDVQTKTNCITVHSSPVASFTADITSTCDVSQQFTFTSTSANTSAWLWSFGDGAISSQQNPNHTYGDSGSYSVTLVNTNSYGCTDTLVQPGYIHVLYNPIPNITVYDSSGCIPFAAYFACSTSASSYLWNFGDSVSSGTQNPSHTYLDAGNYVITLTANYSNGCNNAVSFSPLAVYPSVFGEYSVTNYYGCSPLTVDFHNNSLGTGNSYLWDFGDGTTSIEINPSHVYTVADNYISHLSVTSINGCTTTINRGPYITVRGADATFDADLFSGCPPLTVNFSSLTTAPGVQYNWNFGDGNTSSLANPQHIFLNSGSYNVSLQVTGTTGCSSIYNLPNVISVNNTQSNFSVPAPVTACAPFNVNFSDSSAGAVSWQWDFGDGATSSDQNPSHTYMVPGVYNVSLGTHTNGSNCDQGIPLYSSYIIKGGSADFSFTTELCPPYTAYFNDSSVNAASWLWDFGDGTTSTQENPTHIYANPGSYSIRLTITTNDGCTYTTIHNYAVTFTPLIASPAAHTLDSSPPLNVLFTANSQGATQWLWNFGDGTTSNLPNPTHVYTTMPPYNISLTLSNDSCSITMDFPNVTLGAGGTIIESDSVVIHQPEQQRGCAPLTLYFHNPALNAVSWQWDFGDGQTSNSKNPLHTYADPGTYSVQLVTFDQFGNTDTLVQPNSIVVNGVVADFSISHSSACVGNSINLTNNSPGAISYEWNFGDGNVSSLANPSHLYTNINSNYVISLITTDSAGCTDYLTKSFYGAVNNAISADKRRICVGDTVFFNSSVLNYQSYLWNFGDGLTSALANPYHLYGDTGIFNVNLSVLDADSCLQVFNLPYTVQVFDPVADFIITERKTYCTGGVYITFSNQSSNADSWLWNFGDGTTSTVQNPVHYYPNSGSYNVSLTATKNNCSHTINYPGSVYVTNRSADFSSVANSNCLPISVSFTDASVDAVSWLWEFGDDSTSTTQNPVHHYLKKPLSDVKLTITDMYGCTAVILKPVINPTIANINLEYREGCKPLLVNFNDSSENAVSWLWKFGDGNTSGDQYPTHNYQNAGYYDVELIVQSASGCNDTIRVDSLVHVGGPVAAFNSNLQTGCSPSVVDFNDASLYADSWYWDFGDSSYSSAQNPTHIYNQPGTYPVSLIVADSVGCADTLAVQNTITIKGTVASFAISGNGGCTPYLVSFTNTSINAADYFWSFGDGDSSTLINPIHNFTNPGKYLVTLITHDSSGCESVFSFPDTIFVRESPHALLSLSDSAGCGSLQVSFTNESENGNSYFWNFGDGATSSSFSPTHNYTGIGTYEVSLVTTSMGGCADTLHYPNPISIYNNPVAGFNANITEGCSPLTVSFTSSSANTVNETYFWDFNNGTVSTLANPFIEFTLPGIYTVTLIVSNGGECSDTMTKTAYIKVYEANPPSIATILDATVASDTSVDITWANVADPDLYEYKLFRLNESTGAYTNIYTVIDTNSAGLNVSTTYTDTGLNTLIKSYTYKVQTVDRCGNRIDLSALTPHTTVNVEAATQNKNIHVSWNPYGGCPVSNYQIYRADADNIFKLIGMVPADSLSYVDTTVTCPIEYAYKIKALDLCGSPYFSLSDTTVAIPESDLGNQYVDVVFSTVTDNQNVLTEWGPPQVLPEKVIGYDVFRSVDKINYELAGSTSADELEFTDTNVDVLHQHYYYQVKVVNECDIALLNGAIGSSILLNSDYNEMVESVKLKWTKYEGWDTGVDKYIIERKNANGAWETFKIVDGNTFEAEDR